MIPFLVGIALMLGVAGINQSHIHHEQVEQNTQSLEQQVQTLKAEKKAIIKMSQTKSTSEIDGVEIKNLG